MIRKWLARGAAALALALVAGAASATTITGLLNFGSNPTNYYDPGNGYVPASYANASSPTVTLGSAATFGYQDSSNLDTAAFTATSLVLTDVVSSNAINWTQSFTASTAGFFNHLALTSDTLGVTYSVRGDTLTVNWPGTQTPGAYAADFTFSGGVPEPATWAMLILGVAMVGCAARRPLAAVPAPIAVAA
jgi:hypothetical protein